MSRAALKALSRKSLSLDELFATLDAIHNLPAQAQVLIGASLLEDALKESILRRLKTGLSNNDIASIFENEAPLSSFSARVTMAFAMDIIGHQSRADLNCIRDIRNAFAHARITLGFETAEIAEACGHLTALSRMHGSGRISDWPPTEPAVQYRGSVKMLYMDIIQQGAGGRSVFDTR